MYSFFLHKKMFDVSATNAIFKIKNTKIIQKNAMCTKTVSLLINFSLSTCK